MRDADNANLNASNLPNFGSNRTDTSNAGTFYLHVNNSTSNSNANIGTQQMFLVNALDLESDEGLAIDTLAALPLGKI